MHVTDSVLCVNAIDTDARVVCQHVSTALASLAFAHRE